MSAYRVAINQGETFSVAVQWLDSLGVPVSLAGATAKIEIRDTAGSTVLQTFTSSPAVGLAINTTTATVTWTVSAAVSAAWVFQHAKYDLKITLADTTTKRLLEGDVYVSPQVTV